MKGCRSLGLAVALALLLAGCEPQQSLFPLVTDKDAFLDKQLLGDWQVWEGTSLRPGDKSGLITFRQRFRQTAMT